MVVFQSLLLVLVVAVALAAVARRFHAPYPALLAGLGVLLALTPGMPRIGLDPQLALALFVAPILLDAAYDTSTRDLRDNWLPITGLVLAAVAITIVAVAWTAKAMMPDLPWAAAIALGAIVAPPDAAAATAVLKQSALPHRLTQILEGESLFNDASALLVYRLAVAAAMGEQMSPLEVAPLLVGTVIGSLVAGYVCAKAFSQINRRVDDVPTAIVLQFAGTFGVWIAAEHFGLSGILTVVAYAITIARIAPHTTPARIRVPVVRRVGDDGLRPQRARVRADRPAARPDRPGPLERGARDLRPRRRDRARGGHRFAHRVGHDVQRRRSAGRIGASARAVAHRCCGPPSAAASSSRGAGCAAS